MLISTRAGDHRQRQRANMHVLAWCCRGSRGGSNSSSTSSSNSSTSAANANKCCLVLMLVNTSCLLWLAAVGARFANSGTEAMVSVRATSEALYLMSEATAPLVLSARQAQPKLMGLVNTAHLASERLRGVLQDGRVEALDIAQALVDAVVIEQHVRNISSNVNLVTAVARDPRVRAVDWASYVVSVQPALDWIKDDKLVQHFDQALLDVASFLEHANRFASLMSAVAAANAMEPSTGTGTSGGSGR